MGLEQSTREDIDMHEVLSGSPCSAVQEKWRSPGAGLPWAMVVASSYGCRNEEDDEDDDFDEEDLEELDEEEEEHEEYDLDEELDEEDEEDEDEEDWDDDDEQE
jgi:hypothetical protein